LLARNTLLNLAGHALPLLAALICIPILIQGIGTARFGILTLAWAAIGYFSLFDFGLSRALTQAVAARIGASDEWQLGPVSQVALGLLALLGIIGGAVLALVSPWIVGSVLNIPQGLRTEALIAMYLLAAALPPTLMTAGLRGVLEAHQDFGRATALRVPLATLTFAAPVMVLPFTTSLAAIVGALVTVRFAGWLAHLGVAFRRYHYLGSWASFRGAPMAELLRLSGWMSVSNVVSPMMAYMDRFFIGALLPIVAVAHYVTPFELATRLWIIPAALTGVFFPAIASRFGADRTATGLLLGQGSRATAMALFPPALLLISFAPEVLSIWVGAEFAGTSATVLRWLTVGVFINCLAQMPFGALQGIGRPDLTAKLHLVELPVYAAAIWLFAQWGGLVGVAIAWVVRIGIDAVLLHALALRLLPSSRKDLRLIGGVSLAALMAFAVSVAPESVAVRLAIVAAACAAFAVVAWLWMLNPAERGSLLRLIRGSAPAHTG
jgi:O-antigen/teichoic acid export membrane protein